MPTFGRGLCGGEESRKVRAGRRDEAGTVAGRAVCYAAVPLVFECGKYILTLFFFFFFASCARGNGQINFGKTPKREFSSLTKSKKESDFFSVALSRSDGFPR